MDIIQLLPDHIANQIAAGEVIQRPASAAKEMLENAIDAGANDIKLFIKDGGKTLIQVIDNGCGMSKKDAKMSIERHSTSKIKHTDDLFSITSMGFRGEAIASIASISHLEICTKLTNNELGTKIIIEGGKIVDEEKCVCSNGTSMKIKNLFFNVPARRNFLKSERIETKHIIEQFKRIALSNPDISCSLFINNDKYFQLDSSNLRQRIVNLIGNKSNQKLVPIEEKTNLVEISGFVGKPEFAKKTRGEQYFFVNGRFIKNYNLHHAVTKAYTHLIAENYHPSYFINLKIDPSKIDVNIHPTKTEIQFEDEKEIYAILRSSIKRSLGKYNIAPTLDFNIESAFNMPLANSSSIIKEPQIKVDTNYNPFEKEEYDNKTDLEIYQNNDHQEIQTKINIEDINEESSESFQINNKYIVSKYKDGLIIINQQRAHQKILYEYFNLHQSKKLTSQKLLFSKEINLSKKEILQISEITTELNNIGFEFETLEESLEITGVPPQCIDRDLQKIFNDILHENEQENVIQDRFNSKTLKTLSKTLGIKSGKKLNHTEINMITSELMKCENPSVSPHGLTTYFNIPNSEINKKFSS